MSSRPTLLVVLAFSESLRYDGLSMVRTQGIYTPLRQHLRCGKLRKRGQGLAMGQRVGKAGESRYSYSPFASMSVAVSFMVGRRMMFSVVVCPVFGASIPIVAKLVL